MATKKKVPRTVRHGPPIPRQSATGPRPREIVLVVTGAALGAMAGLTHYHRPWILERLIDDVVRLILRVPGLAEQLASVLPKNEWPTEAAPAPAPKPKGKPGPKPKAKASKKSRPIPGPGVE